METTKLYTEKLTKGSRTYFFDIKKSVRKSLYFTISESKRTADGFEHHEIMVFEEDVEDFINAFRECIVSFRKLKNNQPASTVN
jgi:hypothetical protein